LLTATRVNHWKFCGRRILSPAQIKDPACPIIMVTLLHGAEIAADIEGKLGLPNPVVLLDSKD
jgi:hypothetical protein